MKTGFSFDKLVKHVYEASGKALSLEQLVSLLSLDEEAYQRDSPLSVGKSLTLLSLEFSGHKTLEGTDYPIHYSRVFSKGVNMWVGGNLVGKSSIFKVIKLALTGRKNKNFRTVDSWLDEIWLEFSIGRNSYTTHIKRDKNQQYLFRLINGDRSLLSASVGEQREPAVFEGGIGAYEEFIQGFFFRELSYYSLQWTQNSSKKESTELLTSSASWATYFKSVFLEAEEYDELFYGQQAELIFQMLLGLELTFPINRLKVRRDHLLKQMGKTRNLMEAPAEEEATLAQARQALQEVSSILEQLDASARIASSGGPKEEEKKLEETRQLYAYALKRRTELEAEHGRQLIALNQLQRRSISIDSRINDFRIDITKKERAINDLQEFLEFGAFFNGLEVKVCPNCTHSVEKQRVMQERDTGNCRLCSHELDHVEEDASTVQEQHIQTLQGQRQQLFNDQYNLKIELEEAKTSISNIQERIGAIDHEIQSLPVERLQKQIGELQERITQKSPVFDWQSHVAKVAEFSGKKAVLEQQLDNQKPVKAGLAEKLETMQQQINALEAAEEELKRQRAERSADLIRNFEELYLKQLHAFGLPHYQRVEIKPNFKVAYYFQGQESGFDEITAGEKLRAKLGLYIALIEMDVEHQAGRHPRFIILDSPAKEEGDHTYIEGLKSTLSYIQQHFGEDLQVFVGTAERELATAVDATLVEEKEEGVYFF